MEIKTKRAYDPFEESDGFRVFVDRLWPRGMKKEHFKFDLWEKDMAPSSALRTWMHADKENRWDEFVTRYTGEVKEGDALRSFLEKAKGHDVVTLLTATRDENRNYLSVLKRLMEEMAGQSN